MRKHFVRMIVVMFVLMALAMSVQVPMVQAQAGAGQPPGGADDKTMWCNITTPDFYELCQNQEFMKGLTPEQKKAIDKEWQRRVPAMTPAERNLYYPAGRRYDTSN